MPKYGCMDEYVLGTPMDTYVKQLAFYFNANDIAEDVKKRDVLLTVCGTATLKIAENLLKPVELEGTTYATLKTKLDEYFSPAPNPILKRFQFNKRVQGPTESIADFITDLRRLSDHCEFADLDDRLRDRIVCGARDDKLQQRLFEEGKNLTFQKAVNMALANEEALRSVQDVRTSTGGNSVLFTKQQPSSRPNQSSVHPGKNQSHKRQPQPAKTPLGKPCFRCGEQHSPDTCRFKQTQCRFCNKMGHIEKACITKKHQPAHNKPKYSLRQTERNQNHLEEIESKLVHTNCTPAQAFNHDDITYQMMHHTTAPQENLAPIKVAVQFDEKEIMMEIDSGAGHSIISEDTYGRIWPYKPPLTEENIYLRTWTKQQLPILGSKQVLVKHGNRQATLPILVAAGGGPSLIGRNWFPSLGIHVNTNNHLGHPVLDKFPTLFDGCLGKYKGPAVTIAIESESSPIFLKHRPVPFALKERIERELDRQEEGGILERVQTSRWGTPLVPVIKNNGEIRLCGDYAATVNRVIQKVIYPLPTASEIFTKLSGCILFSKLDLEYAYLQLTVDEDSSDLLTLNTSKGLYRVRRLPSGISSAPSIFQQFMDVLLAGVDGCAALPDDVIIGGRDEAEHWSRVEEVLQRFTKAGLKLRRDKCVWGVGNVKFLGFQVDAQGIHPTTEKVEAIHSAPAPTNKQELQAFLGLYNFYERFLPQKSTILEPLHRLLDLKSSWVWSEVHQQAFENAKQLLRSNAVLTHFDEKKPIVLVCDASPYGVGAVLSHVMGDGTERPIAYGSKTLQPAERNYAQIDREATAIIFGVKKFNQYLAGRHFVIYTDHKPLLGLFHAHRQMPVVLSPRMLRWKLMLQGYDYEIKFRPGKDMGNADGLSRLPIQVLDVTIPNPAEVLLLDSTSECPISADQIARESQRDPILSRVLFWTLHGWPEKVDEEFQPFFRRRQELSVLKNSLLWGARVVIPEKLKAQVLELLHASHQGIVLTKALARSYVWWPKMDEAIESTVMQCHICQSTRNNPPQTVSEGWIHSSNPWSRVHIDFAGPYQGKTFLILVDSCSRWPEVKLMTSMSSSAVIQNMRDIFSTHGLPNTVVSDNGTAFASKEFKDFLDKNGIRQVFAPPYHPSSNGQAERMVQTVKQNLRRLTTGDWQTRLCRMLLSLRNTPCTATGLSPAKVLMHRRPTILLDRLHPASLPSLEEKRRDKAKVKPLRSFQLNDPIYLRNYRPNANEPNKWMPGMVTARSGPVTYEVTTPNNQTQRRHIDQLIGRQQASEPPPSTNPTNETSAKEYEFVSRPVLGVPEEPVPLVIDPTVPSLRRSERLRTTPSYLKDFVLNFEGTDCGVLSRR